MTDIIRRLASQNPAKRATFGQGSFGNECRFCGGIDYLGPLDHEPDCVWVEANKLVDRPVSPNRGQGG